MVQLSTRYNDPEPSNTPTKKFSMQYKE